MSKSCILLILLTASALAVNNSRNKRFKAKEQEVMEAVLTLEEKLIEVTDELKNGNNDKIYNNEVSKNDIAINELNDESVEDNSKDSSNKIAEEHHDKWSLKFGTIITPENENILLY